MRLLLQHYDGHFGIVHSRHSVTYLGIDVGRITYKIAVTVQDDIVAGYVLVKLNGSRQMSGIIK